ncbi:Crp/Fnr family transcriptional regulator [Streptomyces lacrimifluminis]|uniref:Crp/Fnr family transcriptional regulator n=1 Tax=Streptomyces lacrimifluminis TaxID=1500077 RepID=UPI00166A65B2|nr:cyclic nucleotide-binding domain-containing protein [Streptomyces lacrimifluminis]
MSLPADEQFLAPGEDSDHLVVLLRGWVKVVAQSRAGYRALLTLRGPGELLGDQAGLESRRCSASLHTVTTVDLLHLPAARFQALARASTGVTAALEQTLSGRLREADVNRASRVNAVQAPTWRR